MIVHQVESLAAVGVTDIVLAVNYRPEIMREAMKKVQSPHAAGESVEKVRLSANPLAVRGKIQRQYRILVGNGAARDRWSTEAG